MPFINDSTQDSIRFADSVGPDETVTETYQVDRDATVERVVVRIYRGAELDLQVRPFVDTDRAEDRRREQNIVTFVGKDFVDGDGDKWEFSTADPVEDGQYLGVEVTNQDAEYAYDYSVTMTLDYENGTERSILSFIRGWF